MNVDAISIPVARDLVAMARRQATEREALVLSLKARLPREQHALVAKVLAAITNGIEREVVAPLVASYRNL